MLGRPVNHLRQNLVAYLALAVALSGTGYAASTKLLPPNSVGTRQVVNHSLLRKDFKSGQLPRGAPGRQGPTGPQGTQGPKGVRGATGPRGPSGVSAAYTGTSVAPIYWDDVLNYLASIQLPLGKYLLTASASLENHGTQVVVDCFIGRQLLGGIWKQAITPTYSVRLDEPGASGLLDAASTTIHATTTGPALDSANAYFLVCGVSHAAPGSVSLLIKSAEITAIQVDSIAAGS
jgi:hypothetical protein